MNTTNEKRGFTLVEMLVVIAILGILMAMMIPAAGMILKRAKVAQAKSDAGVVVTVMLKYFAEYNRVPSIYIDEEKAGSPHLTAKEWVDVMSPAPGGIPNKDNLKRIMFFEGGGGALGDEKSDFPGAFLDPWGQLFEYQVDLNRDGNIDHPNGEGTIRAGAIAWSHGPDGPDGTWEDNVKSWE